MKEAAEDGISRAEAWEGIGYRLERTGIFSSRYIQT